MFKKNTKAALLWIVGVLERRQIPFQIGGGFAAKLYGVNRDVADIDIAIPEYKFQELLSDVSEYVKFGPVQYKDLNWDLLLMCLMYEGQEIELAGAFDKKFFDKLEGKWISFPSDFLSNEYLHIYGISVPVMKKAKLIEYKKKIGRDVDIEDLKKLSQKYCSKTT